MNAMAPPHGLPIELPLAVPPTPSTARDFDQMQVLRALHRPLVDDTGTYALTTAEVDRQSLRLTLEDDAVYDDGSRVLTTDVATALERAFVRFEGLRVLLGIDSIEVRDARIVVLSTPAAPLVEKILSDVRFTPAPEGRFTGAFVPCADGTFRGRDGSRLRVLHIAGASDAIAAFERGDLIATCPAMFDVRTHLGVRSAISRPVELVARLLFHPRLERGLWSAGLRAAIGQAVKIDDDVLKATLVRCARTPVAHDLPTLPPGEDRPLRLSYGNYWPNHAIAAGVANAFAELGVKVELEPVSLPDLVTRVDRGSFDLALTIQIGMWGPHAHLLESAAGLCARLDAYSRQPIVDLVAAMAWGSEEAASSLERLLFELLPLLPLFRFRSTYLARGPLAEAGLANDLFLRIERLVQE